jgi:CO/xanthine dehydrogenase FAD-binding subunit
VRSPSAETLLRGQKLTPGVLQGAADAVGADIEPMTDHRASAAYRLAMAKVFTKRALSRALGRLN